MSKLVKAVVGTVLRLKCPECAEVFDMSWDIAEDIVDATTGEVIPWICARCQKSKNKQKEDFAGNQQIFEQRNICRPIGGRFSQSAGQNNEYGKESKPIIGDELDNISRVIYTNEEIKKDISEIKATISDIKLELEQLRYLISRRDDADS